MMAMMVVVVAYGNGTHCVSSGHWKRKSDVCVRRWLLDSSSLHRETVTDDCHYHDATAYYNLMEIRAVCAVVNWITPLTNNNRDRKRRWEMTMASMCEHWHASLPAFAGGGRSLGDSTTLCCSVYSSQKCCRCCWWLGWSATKRAENR